MIKNNIIPYVMISENNNTHLVYKQKQTLPLQKRIFC